MDWKNTTRIDRFTFEMIDPNSLNASRGLLNGVVLRESGLTLGYYTDTRISGNIKVVDGNYIENSLIRIHHYVDEENYHNELGTFYVKSADISNKNNIDIQNLQLVSMLFRISDDYFTWHYSVPQMKYSKTVLADIFDRFNVDYSISSTCNNARYGSAKIYEFGENVLSTIFDVCETMSSRLDVNGSGIVTVFPYVAPAAKSPSFTYDATAPDSIMYGDLKVTTDYVSVPNRAAVVFKDGDTEISAYADVSSTSRMSIGRRGRRVTEIITLDTLEPATKAQATQIAKTRLNDIDNEQIEIEFSALYVPMNTGDVATIRYSNYQYRAMLKTREIKFLPGMPTTNTFKVV